MLGAVMRSDQHSILVVEDRCAPTTVLIRIVAPNEYGEMPNVTPGVPYERVYLLFVEPGQRLLVRMVPELAPSVVSLAHAGLLSSLSGRTRFRRCSEHRAQWAASSHSTLSLCRQG
jgi:hypothetical protein